MSLVNFELKKILKKKSSLIAIIIAILAIIGLSQPSFFKNDIAGYSNASVRGQEAVRINRDTAEEYTGYLTDDLISRITNNYAKNISDFKQKGIYDAFSWEAISIFVPNSDDILQKTFQSDEVLQFDNIKLKSQGELHSAFPFHRLKLGNFAPWFHLFEMLSNSFIVVILLIIFLCGSVFSGDVANKMNQLLMTTKNGRTRLTLAKLLAVFIVSSIIYLVVASAILAVFAGYYGFSGWDTSVQMNLFWINNFTNILQFPYELTLLDVLIRLIILQYIGLLFIIGLIELISSLTKNPLSSFASTVLLFFLPSLLMNVVTGGIGNKILTFLDMTTSDTANILLKLSGKNSFFLDGFTNNSLLMVSGRLVVFAFFSYLSYYIIKNKREIS
ncbi:hypothetical protein STRDD10_01036 [Streptococcus sp. DD10]|nr:hypothetical protein STRDD10_01036 [Streptococcus sp. DD10]